MAARLTAYIVASIVAVTFIAGLLVGAQRDADGPVDLIVINGKVYTADGQGTMAEAVAVQGNKILRVGTNREIERLSRPQTVVVDAQGGAVLPGFNDAHTHFLSGSLGLDQIDLQDHRTLDAIRDAVRTWAEANPGREWVIGRGWYYDPFPGGLPTRQMLDALVPDRPVYLTAYDGHTGWANTMALERAGITRRTPNPPNGTIVKDPRTGEPTGALKEAAMALVRRHLPEPTDAEKLAALERGMAEAHRLGITSIQNANGSATEFELWDTLREQGTLALRVYSALPAGDDGLTPEELAQYDAVRARYPDDPLFKTGMIKVYADGVIEAQTAAMLEPYATPAGGTGELTYEPDELNALVAELDRRGWQVMIHAIGDRGIRVALDALEYAAKKNPAPERGRRHRLEHVETIDDADIARFARLGVIASIQPFHGQPGAPGEVGVWSGNLGPERAPRGWLFQSLTKPGGRLAFGSDWPVMSMDPRLGLYVAVNRATLDGELTDDGTEDERLPLKQAIDGYTRDAAWASFDEHRKGSLEPDMLADIVILSRDIFATPASRLLDAEVATTIFDGKVVYRRPARATTETKQPAAAADAH